MDDLKKNARKAFNRAGNTRSDSDWGDNKIHLRNFKKEIRRRETRKSKTTQKLRDSAESTLKIIITN